VTAAANSPSPAVADGADGLPLLPDDPAQLERLVSLAMPFGKYKGTVIANLPGAYLAWFANQGFPKGEIGRLLALMHLIDQAGLRRLLDPLRRPV
jgi:uncharacterized protein (DUF3820 family)